VLLLLHRMNSSFNPLIAARDLGAGVEQLFDGLVIQNRQAMQSMGMSMAQTSVSQFMLKPAPLP